MPLNMIFLFKMLILKYFAEAERIELSNQFPDQQFSRLLPRPFGLPPFVLKRARDSNPKLLHSICLANKVPPCGIYSLIFKVLGIEIFIVERERVELSLTWFFKPSLYRLSYLSIFEWEERFELSTDCFAGNSLWPLGYSHLCSSSRTRIETSNRNDFRIKSAKLYQLSYERILSG